MSDLAFVEGMTLEEYTITTFMIGGTNSAVDNKRNAYAIRAAKSVSPEVHARVLKAVAKARKSWYEWNLTNQRVWAVKVSRRPQRGNHHDSWGIREKYVTCGAKGGHMVKHPRVTGEIQ